ncbi:hypothetical protein BGZ60DRAFT_523647 [Tricladium varicosporioides]|nr:hypothetical protein BGZ60DRAFT_523647 [Hymenoscyphus varicosporioides]
MEEIKSWPPDEKQLKHVQDEDFQEMATLLDEVLFSDSQFFNRMWTLQEFCVVNCSLVKFARSERLWPAKLIQNQELTPEEGQVIRNVSDLVAIYAEFYQDSHRATFWDRNPEKLGQLQAIIGCASGGHRDTRKIVYAWDAGTRGRRLIMSEEKQVGAAVEQAQKADIIYVLIGCSTTVILRKTARPTSSNLLGSAIGMASWMAKL